MEHNTSSKKMLLPEEIVYIELPDGRSYCEFSGEHTHILCGSILVDTSDRIRVVVALGFSVTDSYAVYATDTVTIVAMGTRLKIPIKQRSELLAKSFYVSYN
jgi:hypothetical protein